VILRRSHRVLSLLLSFPCSVFSPHLSISCMGCERSSGCCVILQSHFIGATHNFFPLPCFMPDDSTHQRHLYLIVSIHPVSGSHLVCVSLSSLPRRCVFGFSCSRSYRMCILLSCLDPFRCVYFLSDLSLPFCLYSPLDR